MAKCWIAAVLATFVGAMNLAPARGASLSNDPVAAMARITADLARCEDDPANVSTMAQNGCYGEALEAADKILAAADKAIEAQLAADGARKPDRAKDDHEIARRLKAAQRAWASYREAECSFTATDMLGGTGEAASEMACEFSESRARIKRLAEWQRDNAAQP